MKKYLFILLSLLLLAGCSSAKSEEKEEKKEPEKPWITFDTTDIEANEYGSFTLTGTAESNFDLKYNNHNRSIFVKDNKFKIMALYDKNFPETIDMTFVPFPGAKNTTSIKQTFTLDYSKYIAKKEEKEQLSQDIKDKMPTLLEEIVADSNGQIINIKPTFDNYLTLKVTLPLDLKYGKNGEKKRAMDTLGHDIQTKTASIAKKVPYLTFRYDQTNELIGHSQLMFKNRFTLVDKDTN
ncbi:lipoprotein [Enterococcus quebecensis]|uniref:Lipoprotein n=1 Tax=Enterococcus quebecensis TaxID=903983 RepID=A0A1E5GUE6_9ENTE|nr:lipoprotein [Enterococcus quebecensis]OEG16314.1 hypothetical protein BCR23_05340 [Enterococcus quebecensis]